MYVAINATATPVRLARIKWATGGIFPDFFLQNSDNRSRLQSSQSCVTPSAIFVLLSEGLPVAYCTCSHLIGQEGMQLELCEGARKMHEKFQFNPASHAVHVIVYTP